MATSRFAAPHTQAVPQARRGMRVGSGTLSMLLAVGVILVALVFVRVYVMALAGGTYIRLRVLEKEHTTLLAIQDEFNVTIAELSSPRRIEREAIRLKLKPFTSVQFVR